MDMTWRSVTQRPITEFVPFHDVTADELALINAVCARAYRFFNGYESEERMDGMLDDISERLNSRITVDRPYVTIDRLNLRILIDIVENDEGDTSGAA